MLGYETPGRKKQPYGVMYGCVVYVQYGRTERTHVGYFLVGRKTLEKIRRLLGPPSGQGTGGGARTRDRRNPAGLRADSLCTVPPSPHKSMRVKR
ncbi:hypothetical protein PoB_002941400 [Plakobranchus ocellatus]|uniref:Uncharacterized protein n=1 Tax=Plakobranchus ocellatus TaxID=259542 RepID=A0AAV4A9J8_9GAST|nr:hypothetical protein PoB_002941400 [Plakobranchus ocellatus]